MFRNLLLTLAVLALLLGATEAFLRVTHAGWRESHVHDVQVTREAPNYRPDM